MVYLLQFRTQIFVFLSQGVVAFDENGNRKCKVFIRQFRKSSKLMLKTSTIVKILVLRPFQFQEKEKTNSGYKHNNKVSHGTCIFNLTFCILQHTSS